MKIYTLHIQKKGVCNNTTDVSDEVDVELTNIPDRFTFNSVTTNIKSDNQDTKMVTLSTDVSEHITNTNVNKVDEFKNDTLSSRTETEDQIKESEDDLMGTGLGVASMTTSITNTEIPHTKIAPITTLKSPDSKSPTKSLKMFTDVSNQSDKGYNKKHGHGYVAKNSNVGPKKNYLKEIFHLHQNVLYVMVISFVIGRN